jgi:hypothetical protein
MKILSGAHTADAGASRWTAFAAELLRPPLEKHLR